MCIFNLSVPLNILKTMSIFPITLDLSSLNQINQIHIFFPCDFALGLQIITFNFIDMFQQNCLTCVTARLDLDLTGKFMNPPTGDRI